MYPSLASVSASIVTSVSCLYIEETCVPGGTPACDGVVDSSKAVTSAMTVVAPAHVKFHSCDCGSPAGEPHASVSPGISGTTSTVLLGNSSSSHSGSESSVSLLHVSAVSNCDLLSLLEVVTKHPASGVSVLGTSSHGTLTAHGVIGLSDPGLTYGVVLSVHENCSSSASGAIPTAAGIVPKSGVVLPYTRSFDAH